MPRLFLYLLTMLAFVGAGDPVVHATEALPACGAIPIAMAYQDAGDASAVDAADAWLKRCGDVLLLPDSMALKRTARDARDSLTWPTTLEEAVENIIGTQPPEARDLVMSMKREDLGEHHLSWGMGIRNAFGLWRGNEKLIVSACGGEYCHPDDASMRIIEAVWDRMHSISGSSKK